MTDALLVIGLGPGFYAGKDIHRIIETNRGHNLGRIIAYGLQLPFAKGENPSSSPFYKGGLRGILTAGSKNSLMASALGK